MAASSAFVVAYSIRLRRFGVPARRTAAGSPGRHPARHLARLGNREALSCLEALSESWGLCP